MSNEYVTVLYFLLKNKHTKIVSIELVLLFKMCLSRKCISLESAIKGCAECINLFECVGDLFLELGTCNFY